MKIEYRILCNCKTCKGKKREKYYLELVRGEDQLIEVRTKGLMLKSGKVYLKLIDLENCLKNLKKETAQ